MSGQDFTRLIVAPWAEGAVKNTNAGSKVIDAKRSHPLKNFSCITFLLTPSRTWTPLILANELIIFFDAVFSSYSVFPGPRQNKKRQRVDSYSLSFKSFPKITYLVINLLRTPYTFRTSVRVWPCGRTPHFYRLLLFQKPIYSTCSDSLLLLLRPVRTVSALGLFLATGDTNQTQQARAEQPHRGRYRNYC